MRASLAYPAVRRSAAPSVITGVEISRAWCALDEEHRRLVFVGRHVVRDLQREQVPAFEGRRRVVGGRDVDELRDRRIRGRDVGHPGDDGVQVFVGRRDHGRRRRKLRGRVRQCRGLRRLQRLLQGTRARDQDDLMSCGFEAAPFGARDSEIDRRALDVGGEDVVARRDQARADRRGVGRMDAYARERLVNQRDWLDQWRRVSRRDQGGSRQRQDQGDDAGRHDSFFRSISLSGFRRPGGTANC